MPSSIQKRAALGNDYESITGKDGTVERYSCAYCRFKTPPKVVYLQADEPKRNALNRLRGEIMNHVKEKHPSKIAPQKP